MPTKTGARHHWTVEDVKHKLDRPLEVVIDGAVSYWLEDRTGEQLGPDSERTIDPMARALELQGSGFDPETLTLYALLRTGERYEVASGSILIDMAEAAAGIARHRERHDYEGAP